MHGNFQGGAAVHWWNMASRFQSRFQSQFSALEHPFNVCTPTLPNPSSSPPSAQNIFPKFTPMMRCYFYSQIAKLFEPPCVSMIFWRPFVKRFALCYRTVVCLSCPVCQSVTLVYYGQTVGWIRMPLGLGVGLGPGHIVLH